MAQLISLRKKQKCLTGTKRKRGPESPRPSRHKEDMDRPTKITFGEGRPGLGHHARPLEKLKVADGVCCRVPSFSIVPDALDRDVYLALDDFGGRFGCAWHETDVGHTPVRIVAFNITEGWSRDITDDIAARSEIPQSIVDLIADYPSE
jgi:hypothetical protein